MPPQSLPDTFVEDDFPKKKANAISGKSFHAFHSLPSIAPANE